MFDPTNVRFGCRPSPADSRDFPAKAFMAAAVPRLPDTFTLDERRAPLSQGGTSMCVDFSCRVLKELQEAAETKRFVPMGNGYVYANRAIEDYKGEGMYPREALRTLKNFGVPRPLPTGLPRDSGCAPMSAAIPHERSSGPSTRCIHRC